MSNVNEMLIHTIHESTNGGDVTVKVYAREGGGYCAQINVRGQWMRPQYHDNKAELIEAMVEAVAETADELDFTAMGWNPRCARPVFDAPRVHYPTV